MKKEGIVIVLAEKIIGVVCSMPSLLRNFLSLSLFFLVMVGWWFKTDAWFVPEFNTPISYLLFGVAFILGPAFWFFTLERLVDRIFDHLTPKIQSESEKD